jgi:hypothetical protein
MIKIGFNNLTENCNLRTGNLPGVNTLYFQRRSNFGRWFYEPTSPGQQSLIIGNSITGQQIYPLYFIPSTAEFSETSNTRPARWWECELTVDIIQRNGFDRDKFEQFLVLGDIIIFYEDSNGRWWLLGEEYGTTTSWNSQVNNTFNQYQITFRANQRWPLREISLDYIARLIDPDLVITQLCQATWLQLCGPFAPGWTQLCLLPWNL